MEKILVEKIVNKLNSIKSGEKRQDCFEHLKKSLAKHLPVATVASLAITIAGLTGCVAGGSLVDDHTSVTADVTNPTTEVFSISQTDYDSAEPGTGWIEPATSQVEPATDWTEPATSQVEPVTDWTEPATSQVEPATERVEPVTSYETTEETTYSEPETEFEPAQDDVYIENNFGREWRRLSESILAKNAQNLNDGDKLAIHFTDRIFSKISDGSWYSIQVSYPNTDKKYHNGCDFMIMTNGSSTLMVQNMGGVIYNNGNLGTTYHVQNEVVKETCYAGVYALKAVSDVLAKLCDEMNICGGSFSSKNSDLTFKANNGVVITSRIRQGEFLDLYLGSFTGKSLPAYDYPSVLNSVSYIEPYKKIYKTITRKNPKLAFDRYDFFELKKYGYVEQAIDEDEQIS